MSNQVVLQIEKYAEAHVLVSGLTVIPFPYLYDG